MWFSTKGENNTTAANKMFLQWCRDAMVLTFNFVQRFVSWDRTQLRKRATAEAQTLALGDPMTVEE